MWTHDKAQTISSPMLPLQVTMANAALIVGMMCGSIFKIKYSHIPLKLAQMYPHQFLHQK